MISRNQDLALDQIAALDTGQMKFLIACCNASYIVTRSFYHQYCCCQHTIISDIHTITTETANTAVPGNGLTPPVLFRSKHYIADAGQEAIIASRYGCEEPRKLHGKWPFSLDLLMQSVQADNRHEILRFFIAILERTGSTHVQYLLGARAVNTVDPENVEALLSTHFKGKSPQMGYYHLSNISDLQINQKLLR